MLKHHINYEGKNLLYASIAALLTYLLIDVSHLIFLVGMIHFIAREHELEEKYNRDEI